jgi:putative ABC transport system permease protein
MIKNYFKIAFRNFRRHKVFTFINIIGLTIGISAALVIYLIVHFDFTFDKFHPEGDRIYRVVTDFTFSGEPISNSGVTAPLAGAVKAEVSGLKALAPVCSYLATVVVPNKVKASARFKNEAGIAFADSRFFDIFPHQWLAGNAKAALNAPYQVVLTAKQAKIYFPALSYNQILGRQVIYDDSIKTTVTGIVQDFNENTDFNLYDFISFSTGISAKMETMVDKEWGDTNGDSQLFVKLNPNIKPGNIELQLKELLKKNHPPKPEDKGDTQVFRLQPLNDIHFNSTYNGFDGSRIASKTIMYGLLAIAMFLLLLGCINFINLTTAQASQRAKEIGIRKTMGSTRLQLILQFLSETFIITLFAVIIAMCAAPLILKLFADFIPKGVNADMLYQPVVLGFMLLLTLVVSLLSGFYPAIILSAYQPVLVLKNQAYTNTGKTRNTWLRKSLTVTQFIIAQFFIMATMLISKQIYYVMHKDLGFKQDAILYLGTPYKKANTTLQQVFVDKVKALPQLQLVSVGNMPPSSNSTSSSDGTYRDGKKEVKTELQRKYGDENYMKLYHIKLLAGRELRKDDTKGVIVINETYARVLGFKNPQDAVGIYLDIQKTKTLVIGVMHDFYQKSLHTAIKPLAIFPNEKYNDQIVHIALKPQTANGHEWQNAIAGIQKAWKETYPDDDLDYHFVDESIAKFYESEQRTTKLLSWATGLSIFISCLGLLGLAMYTTNLRTKEIGVRKVLGATVTQIVALLSAELVWLVLLAFVLVTPIAWFVMQKWMQNFTYRTTISWWVFVLSGASMLLTALITLSFQTIKAAIANPARSLKSE